MQIWSSGKTYEKIMESFYIRTRKTFSLGCYSTKIVQSCFSDNCNSFYTFCFHEYIKVDPMIKIKNSLPLFSVFCHECVLFIPTESNYGWCRKRGVGSIDKAVYENSIFCEIDRRKYNHELLTKRLNGEITHTEMYRLFRR